VSRFTDSTAHPRTGRTRVAERKCIHSIPHLAGFHDGLFLAAHARHQYDACVHRDRRDGVVVNCLVLAVLLPLTGILGAVIELAIARFRLSGFIVSCIRYVDVSAGQDFTCDASQAMSWSRAFRQPARCAAIAYALRQVYGDTALASPTASATARVGRKAPASASVAR
jgi:hypothetical protein